MTLKFFERFWLKSGWKKTFIISFLVVAIPISVYLVLQRTFFKPNAADLPPVPYQITISGANPRSISPLIWGMNWGFYAESGAGVTDYMYRWHLDTLENMGIKMLRYPGGCNGDTVDIKPVEAEDGREVIRLAFMENGETKQRYSLPLAEAITFAAGFSAEIMYQVNTDVQPTVTPNPCGQISLYPPAGNKLQRIRDDLEYVMDNYPQIRYFELGNEPWGNRDPEEYVTSALALAQYIKAYNNGDNDFKVGLVGPPSTGNNQDPNAPLYSEWLSAVQGKLAEVCAGGDLCFDFVTDHPYLIHGYSDTASRKITPDLPKPDAAPSASPEIRPGYQYLLYTLIGESGEVAYSFQCPVNYDKGGILGLECNQLTELNISGVAPNPSGRFRGTSAFAYFDGNDQGKQKLAQMVLSDDGILGWFRVCPIDDEVRGEGILWGQCQPGNWQQVNMVNMSVNQRPLLSYDAVPYTYNNIQYVRQSLIEAGEDEDKLWQRNCVLGSYPNGCEEWTSSYPIGLGANMRSFNSSTYYSLQENGNEPVRQNIVESIVTADGRSLRFRVCEVSDAGSIVCPQTYSSFSLENYREVGNESYLSLASVSFSSHDFSAGLSFPYNFYGIASIYAAKEAEEKLVELKSAYEPVKLGVTEWNVKCWGGYGFGKLNFSVGTVDHSFYTAEMLMNMAKQGVVVGGFHDFHPYQQLCGLFSSMNHNHGTLSPAGEAFALTSPLAGGVFLASEETSSSPTEEIPTNPRCNNASCLQGGYSLSYVSSYAGINQDNDKVYVIVINRGAAPLDFRPVFVNLPGSLSSLNSYSFKTLSANSLSSTGFNSVVEQEPTVFTSSTIISLPAESMTRIAFTASVNQSPSPLPSLSPSPFPSTPPPGGIRVKPSKKPSPKLE